MNPDITQSKLLEYFHGELSPEESRQLLQWRDSEDAHRKLFDDTRKEYLTLRWGVRAALIKGDYSAILYRISAKKRRLRFLSAAAAAAVIVLAGTFTALRTHSGGSIEITQIAPPVSHAILELSDGSLVAIGDENTKLSESGIELSVESGELLYPVMEAEESDAAEVIYNKVSLTRGTKPYRIALSDGSSVWLNSDSYLYYPVRFVGNERRVILGGEAWFEVQKSEDKPFIVETSLQEIRVLGTEFCVRAYEDDPMIRTTLVSGSVQVTMSDNQGELVLSPGQQSTLNRHTGQISVETVNTDDFKAWKENMFVIEKLTLHEILTQISRKYDVEFDVLDAQIDDIVLRGSLHGDESLEIVLNALSKAINVKFEMKQYGMIKVTSN